MRSTLFNIYFVSCTAIIASTGYIASFFVSQKTMRHWIGGFGRLGLWGAKHILKATVEIRGRENLPTDQSYLIAAKHQSELDILITTSEFPDMTTVAMKALEKIPFFGRIIRKVGYIIVDLSMPQDSTEQVIGGARAAHAEGRPIVIYPEGTLMALGAKERYRGGIWHIYNDLGISVTPVAMSVGTIWPRREKVKNIGRTGAFEFLPPIKPGLDKDTFMALLEQVVETNTMRLIEEHAHGAELDAARDRYARGVGNEDLPWQAADDAGRQKAKRAK